jgi:hypothetical protein
MVHFGMSAGAPLGVFLTSGTLDKPAGNAPFKHF